MKIAALIARIFLGLIFFVFGLNGFLQFIPMGPLPTGLAGQFADVLMKSHYAQVVSAFQLVCGALLLVNRYVALALAILGPVIVNIFLFHLLMAPSGLPLAIVVIILWAIVAHQHRQAFVGLFAQRLA